MFGWTPREVERQSIRRLYPTETDYELIGERARRAMLTSTVDRDERFMRRKDGQVFCTEGKGTALDPEDPQRLAICICRPLEADTGSAGWLTTTEQRPART